VPPELVRTLAVKDNAQAAWETIKMMRLGCERVREAKAQTRRREFEELKFKTGESIEDFSIRLVAIINDLELLGDPQDEYKAVLKYLRIVPKKFRPMVMAIEQTMNLRELTIEDLTGRLITAEEGYDLDDEVSNGLGKLLLTEEEWESRQLQRGKSTASGSGNSHKSAPKPKKQGAKDGGSSTGERRKGNCRYCGKAGHWAKECRKAKRDRERGSRGRQLCAGRRRGGDAADGIRARGRRGHVCRQRHGSLFPNSRGARLPQRGACTRGAAQVRQRRRRRLVHGHGRVEPHDGRRLCLCRAQQ
jgi:hypothetical protein